MRSAHAYQRSNVASLPERRRVASEALAQADALLPGWPVAWPVELALAFPALATRYRNAVKALDAAGTHEALDAARAGFLGTMRDVARWIRLGGAGGVPHRPGPAPTPGPVPSERVGERQPEARKTEREPR